jgi:hypothetical protein
VLERFSSPIKRAAAFVAPASVAANAVMKALLPILEPMYLVLVRILEPVTDPLSKKLIDFVKRADPSMFDSPRKKGVRDAKDF